MTEEKKEELTVETETAEATKPAETAKTEEKEFKETYKLKVVTIPTNKPCIRKDKDDLIKGAQAGFDFIAASIE